MGKLAKAMGMGALGGVIAGTGAAVKNIREEAKQARLMSLETFKQAGDMALNKQGNDARAAEGLLDRTSNETQRIADRKVTTDQYDVVNKLNDKKQIETEKQNKFSREQLKAQTGLMKQRVEQDASQFILTSKLQGDQLAETIKMNGINSSRLEAMRLTAERQQDEKLEAELKMASDKINAAKGLSDDKIAAALAGSTGTKGMKPEMFKNISIMLADDEVYLNASSAKKTEMIKATFEQLSGLQNVGTGQMEEEDITKVLNMKPEQQQAFYAKLDKTNPVASKTLQQLVAYAANEPSEDSNGSWTSGMTSMIGGAANGIKDVAKGVLKVGGRNYSEEAMLRKENPQTKFETDLAYDNKIAGLLKGKTTNQLFTP